MEVFNDQSLGQVISFTFDPGQMLVSANEMLAALSIEGRVKTSCLSSWMLFRAIGVVTVRNTEY